MDEQRTNPLAETTQPDSGAAFPAGNGAAAENTPPDEQETAFTETHVPVLLEACLDALAVKPEGIYVDGTLGRAGHSLAVVRQLTSGRLIGIDRDVDAIAAAQVRLAPWRDRVTLVQGNFSDLAVLLHSIGVERADGMLFDLGVSSPQLDTPARGFSYQYDTPLDMRMDQSAPLTAREVVNTWDEAELCRILREYGEERYAAVIAKRIVRERPIETTGQLADIVRRALPPKALREKQHPAKRTFQAVRIAVNGELDALSALLDQAADCLAPGGRLAVITFHSLEDRIVKEKFRALARGCTCPPEFPVCVCGKKPVLRLLTRKPVTAGEAELRRNPRARSAKLRIAEKIGGM